MRKTPESTLTRPYHIFSINPFTSSLPLHLQFLRIVVDPLHKFMDHVCRRILELLDPVLQSFNLSLHFLIPQVQDLVYARMSYIPEILPVESSGSQHLYDRFLDRLRVRLRGLRGMICRC